MFLQFLVVLLLCHTYQTARILGIFPLPLYSHQEAFRPMWRELAEKGHEVVVITCDPENDPTSKVQEIDIHQTCYRYKSYIMELLSSNRNSPNGLMRSLKKIDAVLTEHELRLPQVTGLLQNDTEHFDLVMIEAYWQTMFGFAQRFDCPLIELSSMDVNTYMHDLFGNPTHPVAYPDVFSGSEAFNMHFWERLCNALYLPLVKFSSVVDFETKENRNRVWFKYFGNQMPTEQELFGWASMLFLNVVPTLSHRPLGPAVINIGGHLHIKQAKPLPKDLAEFLDGAKEGAIYVSLGTNVKGEFIPENVRQAFLGAFKELPYKILWKLDVELSDVPKNVKIVNWLPQQDVLRHPNIKAFLFQGGLQSLEETIANKIPVVGIPFISDQETNVRKLVKNGYGLGLNKDTITKESLKEALLEVISNPSYKQAIKRMADIIADQPMTGLEKAVWWTEYVIRHKGAHHLRNPIMDMPAYQYYLLDVIGFCLLVTSILMYVLYKLLSFVKMALFRMLLSPASPNKKQKVK